MYIHHLDYIHTGHVKSKMQDFIGAGTHNVSASQEADETRLLMSKAMAPWDIDNCFDPSKAL